MKRKKSFHLTFLFILLLISLFCKANNESTRYRISLLSYAPGSELYSIFGHSAIRVIDDSLSKDYVYNYGTFSFNNSKFYSDFLKGKLLYRLSKAPIEYVVMRNARNGRKIIENRFTLNQSSTKKLISILETNYLPQNREYFYDFFHDNCATRILQAINTATDNKLNKTYKSYSPITFRSHTNYHLKSMPWVKLGINTLMGIAADKKTSGTEAAFLPIHLQAILLENTEIISSQNIILVEGEIKEGKQKIKTSYIFGSILLLAFIISIWEYKENKLYKIVDYIILWPAIIIGVLLLFLWAYSNLHIYNSNLNLLWANPIYLLIIFKKRNTLLMEITIGLCLLIALLYTVIFTKEWAVVLYISAISTRVFKTRYYLILNQLLPRKTFSILP